MVELNSVQNFYKGKTIFITGASGFMGKVLIEKLLYSCSEIKEIIILIRPKKGKTALQRVNEFKDIPVSLIKFVKMYDIKNKFLICRCLKELWVRNPNSLKSCIPYLAM